jgi:hypothetical protein
MFLGVKPSRPEGLICLEEGLKPDDPPLIHGQQVGQPCVDLEPTALAGPGYLNRDDDLPVSGVDEIPGLYPNGVERGRELFKVMKDRPIPLVGALFRRAGWSLQFDLRINEVRGGRQVAFNEGFVNPANQCDVLVGQHLGEVCATAFHEELCRCGACICQRVDVVSEGSQSVDRSRGPVRRRRGLRRHRTTVAAILVVAALTSIGVILSRGSTEARLVPGAGMGGDRFDPLAFRDQLAGVFERRAAAGMSHVLYAKSPGGAAATARRTAAWRTEADAAGERFRVDPALLEAIVFLESAGRQDAVAGHHLEAATGLTQILAETAVNLLGMRVDLPASRRLTRRIKAAAERGDGAAVASLRAARRRVDERFDPGKALLATGRYLALARARFGREDLAIASYHMGIGNLEAALRAYAEDEDGAIKEIVERKRLSYVRLFFDSTPLLHPGAYARLAKLGDDSSTYLWRVLAAREILRLHRDVPAELARLEQLHAAKASAEEVLHPRAATEMFNEASDVTRAMHAARLITLPPSLGSRLSVDNQMGELAGRLGERPSLYRALRPEALALLSYLGTGVEVISGQAPLIVTSTVRDRSYQRLLRGSNGEATGGYSLHTTGYAFDILRSYRSRRQAQAFQFWLDRLQAMNLIAWVREPSAIHVTVSSDAGKLVPYL